MSKEINQPKLLIGEGNDEVRFFQSLLNHLNITDIMVESYQGKDNLPKYLKTLTKRTNFEQLISLGITRDADNLPVYSAFDSICDALKKAGLSVPKNLSNKSEQIPQVSIYILPDNQNTGMLENLCLNSVMNDFAMNCVENYFDCLKSLGNRYPNNLAKAKIHVWLASQIIPDKRLAEAAEAGYWDFNHPAFESLKQFILSL